MAAIFSPDINMPRFYKAAEQIAARFKVSKDEVLETMTEHLLVYYAPFDSSKNSVIFDIAGNIASKGDEIRLDAQDGFVISSWGRAVRRVTKSNEDFVSNEPLMFSNDEKYFDGEAGGVEEYKSLLPYFYGRLDLTEKNGDPILTDYSGLNTLYHSEIETFSLDKSLRYIYPQQMLLGSSNYKANIHFSNGVYAQCEGRKDSKGDARTTQNVAVLLLRGWRVPGLASAKLQADR
jgi:hypothetical protein